VRSANEMGTRALIAHLRIEPEFIFFSLFAFYDGLGYFSSCQAYNELRYLRLYITDINSTLITSTGFSVGVIFSVPFS